MISFQAAMDSFQRLNAGLWFEPRWLQQLSDEATYSRGLALYIGQRVLTLAIAPMGDHWLLMGAVQGGHRTPYQLSIEVGLLQDGRIDYWDSDCTCPMETQCKHGIALMLKAAYQGRQILGAQAVRAPVAPRSPEQVEAERQTQLQRVQERARQVAEAQLLQWLAQMDQAGSGSDLAKRHGHGRPEQFLFLLSVLAAQAQRPMLHLAPVVSYP
ncbi:MAG: helicase SNF2, partial [Betaproteobacteria bacterium]